MITEDYVSFEIAKLLKEKGFVNESPSCINVFKNHKYKIQETVIDADDDVTIPTLQMTMKWLREVHDLIIYIKLVDDGDFYHDAWGFVIYNKFTDKYIKSDKLWLKYEDTSEAAIKYCLENLI